MGLFRQLFFGTIMAVFMIIVVIGIMQSFPELFGGYELGEGEYYTTDCRNQFFGPCNTYNNAFCHYINGKDLEVRKAASEAASQHPGPHSLEQLLDIYDYTKQNIAYISGSRDMASQPYPPNETLYTKSGDCKNQAVLIASMAEATGGSARVVLIPECGHAYAEALLGPKEKADEYREAILAHYGSTPEMTLTLDADGSVWLPLDPAGGQYPGDFYDPCLNAKERYYVYECG